VCPTSLWVVCFLKGLACRRHLPALLPPPPSFLGEAWHQGTSPQDDPCGPSSHSQLRLSQVRSPEPCTPQVVLAGWTCPLPPGLLCLKAKAVLAGDISRHAAPPPSLAFSKRVVKAPPPKMPGGTPSRSVLRLLVPAKSSLESVALVARQAIRTAHPTQGAGWCAQPP
jgi:hypothetical protein